MNLQFEVRKVNSGIDKYEKPFVEVVLRTEDFQAMTLGKYLVTQERMNVEISD